MSAGSSHGGEPMEVLGEHVDVGVDMLECLLDTANTLRHLLELWSRDVVTVVAVGLVQLMLMLLSFSMVAAYDELAFGPTVVTVFYLGLTVVTIGHEVSMPCHGPCLVNLLDREPFVATMHIKSLRERKVYQFRPSSHKGKMIRTMMRVSFIRPQK